MSSSARTKPSRVAYALLWLFVAVTLIAPAAPLNKALFVLLFTWMVKDALWVRQPMRLLPAPALVLGILSYGWLLSWVHRGDAALALQFLTSAFVLLLIHFVRRHAVDIDRIVESTALLLLAATALYWMAIFLPDLPMADSFRVLIQAYGLGALAEREFIQDAPTLSLHLGTVPFLFVAFCLRCDRCFERFHLIDAAILAALGIGIAMSASRGLIAISVFFFVSVMLVRVPPLARLPAASIVVLLLWGAIASYLGDALVLSAEEISNATKIGHVDSYFVDLTWLSALAGRGLANYYYSTGASAHIAHTEITPLDIARYVGIPLAVLLYLVILLPTQRVERYRGANARWVAAFALYALLSATNPVLFNSYGMLVVVWYWSKLFGTGPCLLATATKNTAMPRRHAHKATAL